MTEPSDLTHHILREIRDAIVASRHEAKQGTADLRSELTTLRHEVTERLDVLTFRSEKSEAALLDLTTQQGFIVRHFETLARRDRRLEDQLGR